jgi:uncharacterized protein YjbI with pentapeptide repeats
MGKKLIIKGADFSVNGMRTGNVVNVKLATGGTNPYKLYFLPTELSDYGSTLNPPVLPSDAVENSISMDGDVLINSQTYKSFLFGRNTTGQTTSVIKELICSYDEEITDFKSAFYGVNADKVDLRGLNFSTDCSYKFLFANASIKEVLMPDLYINAAINRMFYNFNVDNPTGTLDISFIKKVYTINNAFSHLYGAFVNFGSPDTSTLDDTSSAFQYCHLQTINLSGWDFSNVNNCYNMFDGCENLKILHLDNWKNDLSGVSSSHYANMFTTTPNLTTVFVTNCNSSQKSWLLARLNECTAGGSTNWVESTVDGKAALVKGS